MSGIKQKIQETLHSGAPGTTGREPFEDSTATGNLPPGAAQGGTHTSTAYATGNEQGRGSGFGQDVRGIDSQHHGANLGSEGQFGQTGINPGLGNSAGNNYGTGTQDAYGTHHGRDAAIGTGGIGAGVAGLAQHEQNKHAGAHTTTGLGSAGYNQSGTHHGGATVADYSKNHGGTYGSQGENYGSGNSAFDTNRAVGGNTHPTDKIGHLGENAALYERSTDRGPLTGGAPGTERFDTDKHRTTQSNTGLTGHGTGKTHNYDGTLPHSGSEDPAKQQSGGVAGIFTTSGQDFTSNTNRLGKGAYEDDQGVFKSNQSGPEGRSALTGREGNNAINPVSGTIPSERSYHDVTGLGTHGSSTGAYEPASGTTGQNVGSTGGVLGSHAVPHSGTGFGTGSHTGGVDATNFQGQTTANEDVTNFPYNQSRHNAHGKTDNNNAVTGHDTAAHEEGHHKKGLMEKIKDVIT
nr:hypothetical protein L203_05332 [Cryptococcus depauperatus CBS 7841]